MMHLAWFGLTFTGIWLARGWLVRNWSFGKKRATLWTCLVGVTLGSHYPLAWMIGYYPTSWVIRVHAVVVSLLIASVCALGPLQLLRVLLTMTWWRSFRWVKLNVAQLRAAAVFVRRLRRIGWRPAVTARKDGEDRNLIVRRQLLEGVAGASMLSASNAALLWGGIHGRSDFQLVEVEVEISGLPKTLEGYSIVQLSDIHAGVLLDPDELALGLGLVKGIKPDLVVVTGDLVDADAGYATGLGRALAALEPRDGVFCILGNHDYLAGADEVARAMRRSGVEPLINSGRVIRSADSGGFALLGVADLHATKYGKAPPDLESASRGVPEGIPRILLSHQPASVERFANKVALQLSGHTHGGQINPFGLARPLFRYLAGGYSVGDTKLYVNRGLGTVGPPSRIGAPPEVTRLVLTSS